VQTEQSATMWESGPRTAAMVFAPLTCRTRWEGAAVTVWLALIDALLLVWMWRRPIDWAKFLLLVVIVASVPLILHLALRTWAAFTLEYWVDRNSITVVWANARQVIPLGRIRRIIRGGVDNLSRTAWFHWPAPYLGSTGRALGLLNIKLLSTRPLPECLLLETDNAVFALSPADADGFLASLQARHSLGPVAALEPVVLRNSPWDRVFHREAIGPLLLGAGLLGVLALFGALMWQFPDLPEALAFHYNTDGLPDVVREKDALFLLPSIGLLAWLANGAWGAWMALRDQRTGAYMLWGGAIIVQAFSFMALYTLIN